MAKVKLEKWEGERRYWKARLTEQLQEEGDGERGGLGWLTAEEMHNVVNRLQYVDVEAHAVKAHTQGGCEGAEIGKRGGGRGRGRDRGMGRMGQGGRGGHGLSHGGGQKEEVNGSGGRGVVRKREDEDDEDTDDERRQNRRTDGDEGVEIDWNITTGDARGEQRAGTRARGTGLEVTEHDGRGRPGPRKSNGCGGNRTLSVMNRVRDRHHSAVINIEFAFTNVNLTIVTRPSTTVITSNNITFSKLSIRL